MNRPAIAIIGLGATGAFAARAAWDMGYVPDIYVQGNPNVTPPGAFWLHWIPDELQLDIVPPEDIHIMGVGKAKNYVKLQWGKRADGLTSSFPTEQVVEKGYNPQIVLPRLVADECEIFQVPYKLSDTDIKDLSVKYAKVFVTFPSQAHIDEICVQRGQTLIPYVAAARLMYKPNDSARNIVVYNGSGKGIVVREAQLFGNHFLEFPKDVNEKEVRKQYDLDAYKVVTLRDLDPETKPLKQDPKAKIYYIGRFAEWDRHTLSHHAYRKVQEVLGSL